MATSSFSTEVPPPAKPEDGDSGRYPGFGRTVLWRTLRYSMLQQALAFAQRRFDNLKSRHRRVTEAL